MAPAVLAMVLGSALLHATWSATMKGARSPLAFNAVQAWLWLVFGLTGCLLFDPRDLDARLWALAAGTGLAHGIYFYTLTRAVESADLTLVYPIVRSTPALLPLLAVPLLGEHLSVPGALGIAVVVAGIWGVQGGRTLRAVFRPELAFAWLTLGTTVAYSLTDKAGMAALQDAAWKGPLPRPLAWFALLATLHAPIYLLLARRRLAPGAVLDSLRYEGLRAAASIAVGVVGYGLILQAYRSAPASYVVAVRQTSVLFTVVIAMIFLGERPLPRRVAGSVATVLGVALIAWGG